MARFAIRAGALAAALLGLLGRGEVVLASEATGPGPGITGGGTEPAPVTAVRSTVSIPMEPQEYDPREVKAFYDWRNDLFFREFDMESTGRTDFMTARRTYKVWHNEFGNPVALTMANPLFYWVDANRNGEFESHLGEMWSDPEEDGVNGNETLYDVDDLKSAGPPAYPFRPLDRPPQ